MQSAYGERIVLSQLHRAIFGKVPCDSYLDADTESFEEIGKEELDALSMHDLSSTLRSSSGVSEAGTSMQTKSRSECSQDDGKFFYYVIL